MFLGFERHQMRDNVIRIKPIYSTVALVEYLMFLQYWRGIYINILGNIVLFIPFGFLGWVFPKLSNMKTLVIHFLSTIIIVESLQYFTRLGVFDIDDIILNTIGVLIGFYLKNIFDNFF
jgi:glycopeptide antibiotics resistance protein